MILFLIEISNCPPQTEKHQEPTQKKKFALLRCHQWPGGRQEMEREVRNQKFRGLISEFRISECRVK